MSNVYTEATALRVRVSLQNQSIDAKIPSYLTN